MRDWILDRMEMEITDALVFSIFVLGVASFIYIISPNASAPYSLLAAVLVCIVIRLLF